MGVKTIIEDVMMPHQRERIYVLFGMDVENPDADYNIRHAKAAVGSGGWTGKGFLNGPMTRYSFVPEQHTDFIFCTVGEEWGFIGVIVVFALVMVIVWRSLFVMLSAREPFAAYLASGVIALYGTHFIINVGMTIGMMPVTGLPLLLLSFGGSSVWTALIALGLVMSVYQHRYQY
jgi:rod shape determining protein RodA